jgi:hypothetical protein
LWKEDAVAVADVQARMLLAYGIRVGPEMGRYVLKNLELAGRAMRELPVIGGEARTGMPLRITVDPEKLLASSPPTS